MDRRRRQALMDAQSILATALAEQKVRVYWDANVPHARMPDHPGAVGSIHLPPLPDVIDERTERLTRAYTGHEAGHIRYTSADVPHSIEDETLFAIWNYIEDGRINKIVGDLFFGLKRDLELVYEESGEDLEKTFEAAMARGEKVSAIVRALGVLTFTAMEVDEETIQRWSKIDDDVIELLETIPDVIESLTTMTSAADALKLAKTVYKRWQDALAREAPPPPPPGHESADGDGGGKGGGGFPYPSKEKKHKKKPEKDGAGGGGAEEDESETAPEKGEDGEDAGEEGAEEDKTGDKGKPGEDGEDGDPDEHRKIGKLFTTDEDEEDERATHALKDEAFHGSARKRKATPEDKGPTFEVEAGRVERHKIKEKTRPERTAEALEAAAQALREAAELSRSLTIGARLSAEVAASIERSYEDAKKNPETCYVAWREQDEIVEVSREVNHRTAALYEEARQRVAFLRTRLFMQLLGEGPLWTRNQARGKIDDRRIYRASMQERRVFKRKVRRPKMNTAIQFLMDYSGSMAEHPDHKGRRGSFIPAGVVPKVDLAIKLAMAFSEASDLLEIPNEVTAFTTNPTMLDVISMSMPSGPGARPNPHVYEPIGAPRVDVFTRWEPLRLMVVKPFELRFKQCIHAFANAKGMGMNNNVDGESVLWAAKRLAERDEENLVLIVLSDGMPHAFGCDMDGIAAHLRGAVQRVKAAGIRVLAFGINSDAVSHFYDQDYVVFNDLDDLVTGGYAQISQILRAARGVSIRR